MASPRLRWIAGSVVGVIALLLTALAVFPWGALRGTIQRRLSEQVGRPVTIGAVERLDSFSFTPTIAIHDVRVPQAAWAGRGDLARIGTARMRFSAWALLAGRFKPLAVEIDGLRLALVRDANRRENWRKSRNEVDRSGSSPLEGLVLHDAHVTYRDAVQQRAFDLTAMSDTAGFRIAGTGTVRGSPVRVTVRGPAIAASAGKAWPFRAAITGPALGLTANGMMRAPLDTDHLTLDLTAKANDLKQVDSIIEAGLISTQPVALTGHVVRDGTTWTVTGVAGTVGHTLIAGHVSVRKADGRTRLDGAVTADQFRFDDFASNDGIAKARMLTATEGPRIVPNARINIAHIDHTDGTITFTARHVVDPGAAAFTAFSGRATIDHQLLTVDPLVFDMKRGRMSGTIRVDQRGGRSVPLVAIDLAIRDSSVGTIAGTGGGEIDARFDGRARLAGRGSTIREAVGNADGTIGAVARDGTIPAKIASMIGFDAGRSLFTGGDEQAGLRCVVLRLDVHHGTGQADPFVIDTTRSQSNGTGTISFPSEALALHLIGRPKGKIVLRLPGAVDVHGTIKQPDIVVPPDLKSIGNIFKAIGRAIRGDQGPLATDADCGGLTRRALN